VTAATIHKRPAWPDRAYALGRVLTAIWFVIAMAPRPSQAAACDEWLRQTVRVTGTYVPVQEPYSRLFVFAMLLDCHGTKEAVTVQRSTASLPVCGLGQSVEVVGQLIWNKALVAGHYEITNPSSVTCSPLSELAPAPVSPTGTGTEPELAQASAPSAPPPFSQAVPPGLSNSSPQIARETGPRVWIGRYRDSRGEGDVTFSLVQGEATVSGTWKLRTGGGGPLTGVSDASGQRFRLRMENTASACPGILDGWIEIGTAALIGAYRGKDCDGPVSDGRLDLHPR